MIRTRGWHWGVAAALIGLGCGSKSEPAAAKVESTSPAPVATAVEPTKSTTANDPVAPPSVVKKATEPAPEGVFLPVEEEVTEIAFPSLPGADGKSIR